MIRFLKAEERVSYSERIGMYLTFPKELLGKDSQT